MRAASTTGKTPTPAAPGPAAAAPRTKTSTRSRQTTTQRPAVATHPGFSYPINVNSATQEELDVLPHIGPALAARIIQYRNTQGPFHNLEELGQVKGIGPKTLTQLAPYVAF
jgi:competence protein ComEA